MKRKRWWTRAQVKELRDWDALFYDPEVEAVRHRPSLGMPAPSLYVICAVAAELCERATGKRTRAVPPLRYYEQSLKRWPVVGGDPVLVFAALAEGIPLLEREVFGDPEPEPAAEAAELH